MKQKPIQMPKSQYMAMPKDQRRRHKDGTYWLRCRHGSFGWVQVVWTN